MIKEKKLLFFKVLVVVMIILFINVGGFLYKFGDIDDGQEKTETKAITGFSMKDSIPNFYSSMPKASKIFFIVQWTSLISLLIYISFRDKKILKRKREFIGIDIKQMKSQSGTDLDTLYNILKQRKQIEIETVAKTFKIKESLAMEWGRVLESGDLAYIDYPKFGGAIIKLEEKKIKKDNKKLEKPLNKKKCEQDKKEANQERKVKEQESGVKEGEERTAQEPKQQKTTKQKTTKQPEQVVKEGEEPLAKEQKKEDKNSINKNKKEINENQQDINENKINKKTKRIKIKKQEPKILVDRKSKREIRKFNRQTRKIKRALKKQIKNPGKTKK